MAADLSIHVLVGATEDDLALFKSSTLGSKYFNPSIGNREDSVYETIANTPSVWVGEVSWLKAAVLGDSESYIPDPVMAITGLVGEDLPVVDDEFIGKAREALGCSNKTGYSVSDDDTVIKFLEAHKGLRVFTVSW